MNPTVKKVLTVAVLLLAGAALNNRIRSIPVLGPKIPVL
jgi:hypothetical protein